MQIRCQREEETFYGDLFALGSAYKSFKNIKAALKYDQLLLNQ